MMKNTEESHFHVHSVLEILDQVGKALSLTEIEALIVEKFGTAAKFSSCSLSEMAPSQVIEFLLARQKIAEIEPGKFVLNTHNSCGH